MTPLSLTEPSGRYLSYEEREEIALMHAKDEGVREIARELGRDPGTIAATAPLAAGSWSIGCW